MSNIYIQEPPTDGKVLLETSVGDIEIELWSRESPKACRNFIQLCMENYYNKTKFHRVVKDFIVQGGDPTGTGRGGESIYGHAFKDEFHSRLRFVRRGLVAMANSGKDDNKSQFFFTFGLTPELQNKHTIFGKVVGNTIYNMLKLQEGVVDEDERPKYPNKILRTKVIKNPFDDLKPRNLIEMIKGDDDKDKKPKSKMKATKDFKLLSFGDEAEEEEEELDSATKQLGAKGKSAHDLLDDEKLSSEVGIEPAARAGIKRKNESSEDEEESSEPVKEREPVNIDSIKDKLSKKKGKAAKEKIAEVMDEDFEGEGDEYVDEKTKARRKKEEIQKEIKALKKEMKTPKEKPPTNTKEDDEEEPESKNQMTEEEKNNDMLRAYHEEQGKYAAKKNKGGPKKGSAREQMTLQLLAKFKEKLHTVKYDEDEEGNRKEREADDVNDHDEEEEGDGWMKNPLKFESNDPVQAKDANRKDDDWFDIYDPRNPINKRRREQDGKNMKR